MISCLLDMQLTVSIVPLTRPCFVSMFHHNITHAPTASVNSASRLFCLLAVFSLFSSYRIAQTFGGGKLWRIDHYRVFGKENVGEFTIATISYSSEPGIWLGKTLANDVRFAKFAKVFPHQSFALYGNTSSCSFFFTPFKGIVTLQRKISVI